MKATDTEKKARAAGEGEHSYGYSPQYPDIPLTDASAVSPDAPLEELNLNWREQDLPERVRTRHVRRLHPYLGKFIPQLVEIFLRKFQPKTAKNRILTTNNPTYGGITWAGLTTR